MTILFRRNWAQLVLGIFPFLVSGEELALRRAGAHYLVDGVFVAGRGPYRFLLDTAADSTAVSPEIARGWAPEFLVEVATATGGGRLEPGRYATLSAGPFQAARVEVLWYDLGAVQRLDPDIAGVLGLSFLRQVDFVLDPRRQVMRPLHAAEKGLAGSGAGSSSGRWVVECWTGGETLRLAIDSGASDLVLFRDGKGAPARLATSGGERLVKMGRLQTLEVGGRRWRDVPAAYVPGGPVRGEDGLLPLRYLDGLLWVSSAHGSLMTPATHSVAAAPR